MKIISASRRTDIPAFYGDWFMNRIDEGFAGYINPFNNKKYIVSLKKEDTAAIVLWSKNFSPFADNAIKLRDSGYSLFFNYTITGLSKIFEPNAPADDEAIDSMKLLSSEFSPDHIKWRYDPVLVSDITKSDYHIEKFETLCRSLSGYVKRCYISFPTPYGKVERSFKNFTDKTGIKIISEDIGTRVNMALKFSEIGERYGIRLFSCCGDYLSADHISKGSCIDKTILSSISGKDLSHIKLRPTRKECGCTESTDIGIYDSCPHGCIYCYANCNAARASSFYKRYLSDADFQNSAFLGESKAMSDLWIKEIKENLNKSNNDDPVQPLLF